MLNSAKMSLFAFGTLFDNVEISDYKFFETTKETL